ncbi:IS3 family transposase [Paenibacillus sp. CCS19]|uniref:IS3 family transposase n=1 Tax=Paenibacillus sp. CCS19 TaxID=3158387 RepID=UPI00295F073D|nr:IS3 family transposase [Paenibacillus cellulosilyticus]
MVTRVSYPLEVKMKAIELRLAGVTNREIMEQLNIRNKSQVETWLRWYHAGELHRLEQPVGKQYSYGKGPEYESETEKLRAENRFLKQQVEVPKKVQGVGKELSPEVVIPWMESIKTIVTVQQACDWIGLPRSTYYRWKKQGLTTKSDELVSRIREMCQRHRFRYGYRKITAQLRRQEKVNHKRVQRIMQQNGWQCRVKVKKRKQTGQPAYVAEHLLQRKFAAERPLQKLVTDITYLPYGNSMMYLSSILDLYNGEVVAYSIGDKQDVHFVLDTLQQLPDAGGAMLHSDQGSVYTSYAYQHAVKEKGITMSMSRKGTPADNALIESFHSTLKSETFYLENLTCTTTAIVVQTVQEYIQYYNAIRIQAKLNNQSPIEYRQLAA